MSYESLTSGQKIFFQGEGIPMELISRTERYGVVVRSLDIEEDYNLIYFQVERGAYDTCESAYEDLKSEPVYSILDFQEEKRAPNNYIFNPYDYWSKESIEESLKDLENGEYEL